MMSIRAFFRALPDSLMIETWVSLRLRAAETTLAVKPPAVALWDLESPSTTAGIHPALELEVPGPPR
jgi:hypothetical protein